MKKPRTRNENYWWLVGVDLGGWNYDGLAVDHEGRLQYCFIDQKGQLQFMYYKEFRQYIRQFDLTEYKRTAKR